MSVSRRWHITLTSTSSPNPVSFSLHKGLGVSLISVVGVCVLCLILMFIYTFHHQVKISDLTRMESENKILREKLTELSVEMDSILNRVRTMEQWEDNIRQEKKFESISEDLRNAGTGGLPQYVSVPGLDDKFNLEYNAILSKISHINNKLEYDSKTHQDLAELISLKNEMYLYTPSIYPSFGRISDAYGWRKHPIYKTKMFHNGIDFANKTGTPIYATASGTIKRVGKKKYFGRYIEINHKFGYTTKYAHLHKAIVKEGQEVSKGQIIGYMGNTGRSTGTHLHYEVLQYGKFRNPYKYLNKMEDDIIVTR